MVRNVLDGTYRCALENFTSHGKFWKSCKILGTAARLVSRRDSRLASSLCGTTQWSEKLLFFTMQHFVIYHTIKTEIAYGKFWKRRTIISSFSFYKNLVALIFRRFSFPVFPSFFQISKISQLMVQLFQPLQLPQLQLFQLFGIGPYVPP